MALFNVFSDPALKARQDILDAQWNSLWSIYQGCDNAPNNTFSEFVTERTAWKEFYDSGSDWSASSKAATDQWQSKAQEWASQFTSWGCNGNLGSVNGVSIPADVNSIPTVKDPPPDGPSFIDTALQTFQKTESSILSPFATIGWVAVGLAVLIILALVWSLTKGHAKGYGVEIGGK